MTYLAAGSSVPETIQINLDDQGSIRRALALLNATYPTSRISAGMEVADIQGVGGAVFLRQVWDLTNGVRLSPGDLIVGADGAKIDDGTAFEALVSKKKQGEQIVLQVRGKDGSTRSVPLKLQNFSRVVGYLDETLPINKLIFDSRSAVLDAPNPQEQSIARLNLAVVLMRALNFEAALNELEKVDLRDLTAPQQGISRGTVQYYLGLCFEALDRSAEAMKAFQAAAASPGALLTGDDNTLVKPLAEDKLKSRRQQ